MTTEIDRFRDEHIDDIISLGRFKFHIGSIYNACAELLEVFPDYDYNRSTYKDRLHFSHPDNWVGLQQRCFNFYWASRTIWISGLLGIELGSGGYKTPYCLSTDIVSGAETEMIVDGGDLPFLDNSIELILANHMLEHVDKPLTEILQHWVSKLRLHGIAAIICPDNKYDDVLAMDDTHVHATDSRTFVDILDNVQGIKVMEYDTLNNGFSFNVVFRKV